MDWRKTALRPPLVTGCKTERIAWTVMTRKEAYTTWPAFRTVDNSRQDGERTAEW